MKVVVGYFFGISKQRSCASSATNTTSISTCPYSTQTIKLTGAPLPLLPSFLLLIHQLRQQRQQHHPHSRLPSLHNTPELATDDDTQSRAAPYSDATVLTTMINEPDSHTPVQAETDPTTIQLPSVEEQQQQASSNNDNDSHDDNASNGPPPHHRRAQEPPRDDEGLLLDYDVLICGTGLVQSILASALTRAGQSVLHCDGSDLYGELDAVWTFETIQALYNNINNNNNQPPEQQSLQGPEETVKNGEERQVDTATIPLSPKGSLASLQFHSMHTTQYFGITVGTAVVSPYGNGIVRSLDTPTKEMSSCTLQLELVDWKLADTTSSSPTVYVSVPSSIVVDDPIQLEKYLHQQQKIRSKTSVEAEELLRLHRFFSLDATPALILASGPAVTGMLASNVADYLEFKPIEGLYWLEKATTKTEQKHDFELSRVPCSKNDVFGTKLLAPMDKRRLMKFIQLSMDYATKMAVTEELEGEVVESEVEVLSLNERHLNQGRSLARPQNKAVASNELQVLEQHMEEDKLTFDEFLTQQYKLSPKLRSIVRYALAWETDPTSTSLSKGILALRQHLQALGRYGTTAFLCPIYGSGELSQAFCRSAAVFGATYLLRRAPLAIQYVTEDDDSMVVSGVLLSSDTVEEESSIPEKMVRCSHVVVPSAAILKSTQTTSRIVRRLSILQGRVVPSDNGEQRYVVFIPPNTVGNTHPIQGVLLDRSVAVSPYGCTLLHLTTTVEESETDLDAILERAESALLKSKCPGNETISESTSPNKLYHVTFSHAQSSELPAEMPPKIPNEVHLCHHSGQALTVDVAFEQAKSLFSTLCPGAEFLGLSNSFDEAIRERAQEKRYDDDEKLMLESALGMIGQETENSTDNVDNSIPRASGNDQATGSS